MAIPMRKSKGREKFVIDYTEIEEIRQAIKSLVNKYRLKRRVQRRRGHYDRSWVYIGRKTTHLAFSQLYVPSHRMRLVAKGLAATLLNNSCYIEGNDIHVYLRGKRR